MKKLPVLLLPLLCTTFLIAGEDAKIPPMPAATTLNAVASLRSGLDVYSIMGVGTKKEWNDISNKMYVLHFKSGKWIEERAVPGVAGRLAASAIGVKGEVF